MLLLLALTIFLEVIQVDALSDWCITDTNNQLSIRVHPKNYKGWLVRDTPPTASENLSVTVGHLTCIARHSGSYSFAESKTKWLAPFDEILKAVKHAINNQFILNDFEATPSSTEPSTAGSSTTSSSIALGMTHNKIDKNDTNKAGGLGSNNSSNQRKLPTTGSQQSFLFIDLDSLLLIIAASLLLFANYRKVDLRRLEVNLWFK
ncbi:hypothetical protein [Candidatus Enterococcus ferrettii]|uniref:Uncharacterized protein n=1 Tax=Candidatus Enterococcus ferrettii TaxID=2815324 RepID=A0ABV0ELN6_9ENTE|nr:hypothetical protein [Enterococcus sp. 665A]MBO1342161.1 hypothetical protein [Enterococcus sp. 665A]